MARMLVERFLGAVIQKLKIAMQRAWRVSRKPGAIQLVIHAEIMFEIKAAPVLSNPGRSQNR
jgi:hypothetical protein